MELDPTKPINADHLILSFNQDLITKTYSAGCYAPPQKVEVTSLKRNDATVSYSSAAIDFAVDSSGKYTAAIPFTDANGHSFTDGPYTLKYKLTDASGMFSTGTITFSLHRAQPSPVSLSMLERKYGDSDAWSLKDDGFWGLLADKVPSVLASDTLIIRYQDSELDSTLSTLPSYKIEITDLTANTSTELNLVSSCASYVFAWGAENSRKLIVQAKDETGKPSISKTVRIFKPQWGSAGPFMAPARQPFDGALSGIFWQNQTIGNGTRGLKWGIGTDGTCIANPATEVTNATGIELSPNSDCVKVQGATPYYSSDLIAGKTVYYEPYIEITADPGHTENVNITQNIRIEAPAALSYQVPYSSLPQLALGTQWLGAKARLTQHNILIQTEDGNTIHYRFELGIDNGHGEFSTSTSYEKQTITPSINVSGQETDPIYDLICDYNLWKMCKLDSNTNSLSQLKGVLQSNKILIKLDEWIDTEPADFSVPSNLNAYKQLSFGNINWDVDPPQITFSGMMASANVATNSKTVSGTASDNTEGSGLRSVKVSWAPIVGGSTQSFVDPQSVSFDSAGNFNFPLPLADEQYSIQVIAEDNAGNQFNTSAIPKVLDTTPPVLVANSFHFVTSETDPEGNTYVGADGAITAVIEVNENGGAGLAEAAYQWTEGQAPTTSVWTAAVVSPVPTALFDVPHSTDTYSLTFAGAQDGVRKLHIKLTDKAGNSSEWPASGSSAWAVRYSAAGPDVALSVGGMRNASGRNWIRQASDLSVSYVPTDTSGANPVKDARWNVQLVEQNGTAQENGDEWSQWGQTFEEVRSRISSDGQCYRVQLQVRNANDVVGPVLSSPVFIKDGIGPQGVTASIVGSEFIVGQSIQVHTAATDQCGTVQWSWSYQSLGATGAGESQGYRPGSDIVIPSAGTFSVVFTATSGSGISVSASPIVMTVSGTGLFVNNQNFNAGTGKIVARWGYAGGSPASYANRWIRLGDRAALRDWSVQQQTTSTILDLDVTTQASSVTLSDGESVAVEVEAFDADGNVLADVTSAGSVVDTTPPVVALTAVPVYVAPNDVWLTFTGSDTQSGATGGTVLVKRSVIQPDGSWAWALVRQDNLASIEAAGQRLDIDLSGTGGVATADRIVVEVSVENGAGLTTTQESGIMIVDGTAPPAPFVMPMAEAVRYKPSGVQGDPLGSRYQTLSFNWNFTSPDPESGTVKYYWKAYTNTGELTTNPWTQVSGGTSVSGLDFSQLRYGSDSGTYSDGTVLFFAVKAVNGVGLESVGYSRGVVLDSKAPWVNTVIAVTSSGGVKTAIAGHVQLTALGSPPSVLGQVDSGDYESGLKGFDVQAGTWNNATGFLAVGDPVEGSNISAAQLQYSPALSLGSGSQTAQVGSIWMLKGHAVDNAGNESVLYSPAFRAEGSFPAIAALQMNLSENSVSFSWQVDSDSDFIQNYQLIIGDKTPIVQTQKLWSGSWKELGYKEGDEIHATVWPVTALGLGGSKTVSMTICTTVPVLADFKYTKYFSDHFNVKAVNYTPVKGPGSVQQIQWKLTDAFTGQILQDWTSDYRGMANTEWKAPYTAMISDAHMIPVDGQTLALEVKAQSRTGIWSVTTPSETILVDETPASGISISRASRYSNASGNTGVIDGWTLAAKDSQSGLLAYQTMLSMDLDPDWSMATLPVSIADNLPAVDWSTAGVGIERASQQRSYYAFVRFRNGTEDWGPAIASEYQVDINWTAPVLGLIYSNTVLKERDGNALTNEQAEMLTFTSGKEGTAFELSVNSALYGSQPVTKNGRPPGSSDTSINSYGTVTVSGPGTADFSVIGTDLYGNKTTMGDVLRFNAAPAVSIAGGGASVMTTPGAPLTLEKLVRVEDEERDYPITYSWNLGGGSPIDFSDQQKVVFAWPDAGNTAAYFQFGRNQQTSYTLKLTVSDFWGKSQVASIPVEVHNTTAGTLFTSEYWTGPVTLTGIVEVPSSLSLTLDSVDGTVNAIFGEDDVMDGGIVVDSGALLTVANSGTRSVFDAIYSGLLWRGITVGGTASGSGLELQCAERGLILLPAGSLSLSQAVLSEDLIGIHLLGGTMNLIGATFTDNIEYGIKEDGAGAYGVLSSVFFNNGVNYYRQGITQITMDELNALPGNSGNR